MTKCSPLQERANPNKIKERSRIHVRISLPERLGGEHTEEQQRGEDRRTEICAFGVPETARRVLGSSPRRDRTKRKRCAVRPPGGAIQPQERGHSQQHWGVHERP